MPMNHDFIDDGLDTFDNSADQDDDINAVSLASLFSGLFPSLFPGLFPSLFPGLFLGRDGTLCTARPPSASQGSSPQGS
jgi:hypothetical protein